MSEIVNAEKAHEVLQRIVRRPPKNSHESKARAFTRHLLPGVRSVEQDYLIRKIVSMQFSGMEDAVISRSLEKTDSYVAKLVERKPEAFDEAKRQHIDAVLTKHAQALIEVRSHLSDAAIEAVKCLTGILRDPEASASVRRRAATDVLNLFYMGRTRGEGGKDSVNISVANFISEALPKSQSGTEAYVVDAEYEETDV